jgi:putative heme-binding domain-containing protein
MGIVSRRLATTGVIAIAAALAIATAQEPAGAPAQKSPAPQLSREDVLATQMKDEKGGTAADGRPLFEERCAACHRFGGLGRDVGPDLTTITSRFKKADILDSILWPSKVVSDQYQAEMFEMNDGKIVTGLIVRESATAILVRTAEAPDKPAVVTKAQIANRAPSAASMMPEGLHEGLTQKQLADLLAFVMAPPPEK